MPKRPLPEPAILSRSRSSLAVGQLPSPFHSAIPPGSHRARTTLAAARAGASALLLHEGVPALEAAGEPAEAHPGAVLVLVPLGRVRENLGAERVDDQIEF